MYTFDDESCAADGSVAPVHANVKFPADAPLSSDNVKMPLLKAAVLVRPEGTLKVHDGFDGHEKLVKVTRTLPEGGILEKDVIVMKVLTSVLEGTLFDNVIAASDIDSKMATSVPVLVVSISAPADV
jgi:hypothetical protein